MKSAERIFIPSHAPSLFDRARECAKSCQGVAAVILCVSSVEALIHDFTEWYKYSIGHNGSCPGNKITGGLSLNKHVFCLSPAHSITDKEVELYKRLQELEMKRRQLEEKVVCIFKLFEECPPKGGAIWQDFVLLSKVRNGIVHMKGESLIQNSLPGKDGSVLEGYPSFIKRLQDKEIIRTPTVLDRTVGWLELIEKDKNFLTWCVESTKNYLRLIVDRLPDTVVSDVLKLQMKF